MKETPYGHCLYGVKLSVEDAGDETFVSFCFQRGFEFGDFAHQLILLLPEIAIAIP